MEASIGLYKRVIGDVLRSQTDATEATNGAIAAAALDKMRRLGRPNCVRIASITNLPASKFGPMVCVQHSPFCRTWGGARMDEGSYEARKRALVHFADGEKGSPQLLVRLASIISVMFTHHRIKQSTEVL